MNADQKKLNIRWLYLAVGVVALLFAGIIYGWSILKAPLASELHWADNQLALNFTLTMCFFCLGGIAGGVLSKRAGTRISLILAAVLNLTLVKRMVDSMWQFTFRFTLTPALGACGVLLLVAAVVPAAALGCFHKGSIVEQLRMAE